MDFTRGKLSARVVAEPIEADRPPGALLGPLDRHPDPAMLDSSALHGQYGRYTVLACEPLEVLRLRSGVLTDRAGRVLADDRPGLWAALREAFGCVEVAGPQPQTGYVPGWIGYFGYELGRSIERLPARAVRDTPLPDLRIAFYDALLVYDALERRWRLVALAFDRPPAGAGRAADALRAVAREARADPSGADLPEAPPASATPRQAPSPRPSRTSPPTSTSGPSRDASSTSPPATSSR